MWRIIEIECPVCKGTGLYRGFLEKNGAAVECHKCNGSGKTEFTYNEFEGRKELEGVTRVFESGFGYAHSGEDVTYDNGETVHFSKYGCSYEEWKSGVKPTPVEELYCPYTYSGTEFVCTRCNEGCLAIGTTVGQCKFHDEKEKCWAEWHEKND